MADFDYGKMQSTAIRLLDRFKQGTITLVREDNEVVDPEKPWKVAKFSPVSYPLKAVVDPVDNRYVDGTTVTNTDDQVTFAPFGLEPLKSDLIFIDSKRHTIKKLLRYPNAGLPIYYIAIVNA